MRKSALLPLVILVAASVAGAQAVTYQPKAVVVTSAYRIFTGSPGWVGVGPGAVSPYGGAYPMSRLDVNGDADTRIRIDGSTTSGIFFTRGGTDGGTIRSTANGIELWTSNNALTLVLQGLGAHFLGNVQVDGNIAARYQDVAEWVTGPSLPTGTVVVVQEANRVIASSKAYDPRVIGVVSERPAILLGERAATKIKVAHSGRVRIKVIAPVVVGDLLVASDTPGRAMRGAPRDVVPGAVLGKALESWDRDDGEILMLLTLQ